jgi:hypothetical protein
MITILIAEDMDMIRGALAAGQLDEQLPECQALVLTEVSQPCNLFRVLKLHMCGFIVKDAPAATLAGGIRQMARGASSTLTWRLWPWRRGAGPLTQREADVLRAAADASPLGQPEIRCSLELVAWPSHVQGMPARRDADCRGRRIALVHYEGAAVRSVGAFVKVKGYRGSILGLKKSNKSSGYYFSGVNCECRRVSRQRDR